MDRMDQPRALTGLVVAVLSVAAITGVIFGLREVVPVVSTGVVYMLAVLLVSSYWGLWLGLATALLSAAAFNFFHIPPTGGFTIAEGENWVALAVFFVAAVVDQHARRAPRARAPRRRSTRRREADLTAEMARLLLGGAELEESLRAAGQRIAPGLRPPVGVDRAGLGRLATSAVARCRCSWTARASGTVLVPADTDAERARRPPGPGGARRSRRWWPPRASARSSRRR